MTSEIKIAIFIKCIIRSNRLKKVQSKFTTLQITFNFPFERKHKLITIAQFTKQSRIIQHPITREEKKKSQSTFRTHHFPRSIGHALQKSLPQKGRSTLLSQLYDFLHKQAFQLQNCGYIYISELSSVWVALVRRTGSRVAALQMRDLPATIQRENPLEGVAAPFRSWLINLHTHFFVRTFAMLLPIWTTVCIQYPIGISSFPIL